MEGKQGIMFLNGRKETRKEKLVSFFLPSYKTSYPYKKKREKHVLPLKIDQCIKSMETISSDYSHNH